MSLTVASTFARRGRHAAAIHPGALASVGSGIVPRHPGHQTRNYRFGRFSSYLEPYMRPDLYTRHKLAGYNKYCEHLYRRRSSDKHSLAEDAKSALKRVVDNYWSPHHRAGQATGRCLNTDASPRRTPENPDGVRPGQNIEDVERAPLEHLLFGDKKAQRAKKQVRPSTSRDRVVSSSQNTDADYVIDPISNRKVLKKSRSGYSASEKGIEIPVRTSKGYRSQFEPLRAPEVEDAQAPIFSDGPPPEAELKMYGQDKQQRAPVGNHYGTPRSSLLDTLNWEHKEVQWHRNDTITSASATSTAVSWAQRPDAPQYSDLHHYTAVRHQEPDGKSLDEQRVPTYEDLDKYGAISAHEPDGKYKVDSESPANPEELKGYGAVRSHEPDGKYKSSPESAADSQELNQYGAVRSHEPDGKYKIDSESVVGAQELDQYGAVRSHEPDGKYKVGSESTVDSEELQRYGAVRAHEPDGKYKIEAESAVDPQELEGYGAIRSHEPDGKYAAEYTETPDEAELAAYSKPILANEPDGKYAANYVVPEYDAAELAKYRNPFFSHEPDGKYAAAYVEPAQEEAELSQYKAFRSHEPDGKYAANYVEEKPDAGELGTYGAFRSHEPDGKYALRDATPAAPAETQKYGAFRSHEPDGKYAANHTEEKPGADELATYKAFHSHEPDGKYAAEAAAANETEDLANHEAFGYDDAETRPLPQECQPSKNAPDLEGYRTPKLDERQDPTASSSAHEDYDPAELRKYQAVRWNEPDGNPATAEAAGQTLGYDMNGETNYEKTPYRMKVDELMARTAAESDVAEPSQAQKPALTGNYVRDFPEDFSKSWANSMAQGTSSLLSPEQKESDRTVQPALDRYNTPDTSSGSGDAASQAPNPASPALYKILVYDPTMQCIETAETTSVVPDTAAPLTPAEVLLRISNPAKFFPHFAPLQAQGFEIVSGSGDVLIFRKVREAVAAAAAAAAASPSTREAAVMPINPIDMTGERRADEYTVAAGRFASPTGFVNYDLPPRVERRAAEEVRREGEAAPVREEKEGKVGTKGKRSWPRRAAIGAASLAGGVYAVGVVSQYSRSAGVDGKGPKGF
jgi:hypothetical protein